MSLFITDYTVSGDFLEWNTALPEIRHGQLWRLITPIFIHFGPLHIFFNMLWLRDLGSMIEGRQSSWRLALLVLVIAAVLQPGPVLLSADRCSAACQAWCTGCSATSGCGANSIPPPACILHPSTVDDDDHLVLCLLHAPHSPTSPTPPMPSAWSWASPGATSRASATADQRQQHRQRIRRSDRITSFSSPCWRWPRSSCVLQLAGSTMTLHTFVNHIVKANYDTDLPPQIPGQIRSGRQHRSAGRQQPHLRFLRSARAAEPGANDKVRLGLIGCGGMGQGDLECFFLNPEVDCVVDLRRGRRPHRQRRRDLRSRSAARSPTR